MNCLKCGKELSAIGGVPTIWMCNNCISISKKVKGKPIKYVGDTLATLRELK
jgi:ribosomal protein L37AE/L43A